MGSYHSRQIADLVLLLSELKFFSKNDTTGLFIFCRYIDDDGFMLTDKNNNTDLITHLSSTYPSQIPITFTTNCHSTHYLDLTISLNYHTIMYHNIHHCIYQKPHHKYMYPHFSSLQIIHNTFSQASSRLRQYDTADCQRPKTTTTLYTDCLPYDSPHLITQTNLLQKTLSHGYLTTITNDDNLPTKHTATITNLQSTTAANTTNTLELTKLYATSYTNTTTCISPN